MENDGFHPHTQYKGVRKSRDQTTKTEGTRFSRNRFHPKGYKPPTFGKKKPEGKWEITETDYNPNKTVWKVVLEDPMAESGTNVHYITLGKEATEYDVKNALLRMQKNGVFMYYDQDVNYPYLHSIQRLKRDFTESDIIKMIHDKNLNVEKVNDVDDDGNPITFLEVKISKQMTLDAVNDNRNALEIVDHITGMTEDERLRNNITISNGLYELEKEGKIKIKNGKWIKT